jgi:hypothetical protein
MSTGNLNPVSSYWLCPLYSFSCDCGGVELAEGIQIIPIPRRFVEYLDRRYSGALKTLPSDAEWVAKFPSDGNTSTASNSLVDLMTALRLHRRGRVVAGLLTSARFEDSEWDIGGTTIWSSVSSIDFFQEDPVYEFRGTDVPEVNKLLVDIHRCREAGILSKINIALERFHSAYHGHIEDRIIDQIIAFESLYLGNEQELTYKLASRVAFLIRKRKDHRILIFNNIRRAYNYRSRVVHGDNPPTRYELRAMVSKAEEYLRQSIRKFLLLLSKRHSVKRLRQGARGKLAELDENILSNGRLLA